ncbi:MAG: hypothetical protein WCZ43_03695 [Proteiniphilum sp.]
MKKIIYFIISMIIFGVGCMPNFNEDFELSDNPMYSRLLVGNDKGMIPIEIVRIEEKNIDSILLKDRTAELTKLFLRANTERGVIIEPLEDAPKFGTYGDFSSPRKYRFTAPSGNTIDWIFVFDYFTPQIGCLTDRWNGEVSCYDAIYPSYSPINCVGEKIEANCNKLNLTFNFWNDESALAVFKLELGEINFETLQGNVILLDNVHVASYGSEMTFHAGEAGIYNAMSNEIHLKIKFSGYNIGNTYYSFTISQIV